MAARKRKPRAGQPADAIADDRVTYRELRNTPGRVWARLANDQTLTLIAEGVPRALVIPITNGDAGTALEAYRRGRALLAMNRIQAEARKTGASKLTIAQINKLINDTRRELREGGAE